MMNFPVPGDFRSFRLASALIAIAALSVGSLPARAQIETNQEYIESVTRTGDLDITSPTAVFAHVFAGLKDQVKVYTGENYFYFKFFLNGIRYAGNIRLDATDRDDGVVHFAYFRDYTGWAGEARLQYKKMTAEDGIAVEKLGDLLYGVSHGGRTVRFELIDLRPMMMAADELRSDEDYIGPVADESGVTFQLVYNRTFKMFQYFLTVDQDVADEFFTSRLSDSILIGRRTGFAFYIDKYRKRKILIGVHMANSSLNNYLDGPFDQLPDNFIGDGRLRDAILDIDPTLAGTIDQFGNSADGSERYFVGSYLHWEYQDEFKAMVDCAADPRLSETLYYGCFAVENSESEYPDDSGGAGNPTKPATKGDTPRPSQ